MGEVGIAQETYVYDPCRVDNRAGRYPGERAIVLEVVACQAAVANVPPGCEFRVIWAGG